MSVLTIYTWWLL